MSARLTLAIAEYLCRHRSAGLIRITLDLLKDPELREAWRKLGIDPAQVRPGDPLLFKAVKIVQEHVEYLQRYNVAEYIHSAVFTFGEPRELLFLPGIQVANWKGKPCGSPTPPPTSPPPENSPPTAVGNATKCSLRAVKCGVTAEDVQKGGRGRATIDV
jgi:hypothetical protein